MKSSTLERIKKANKQADLARLNKQWATYGQRYVEQYCKQSWKDYKTVEDFVAPLQCQSFSDWVK